MWTEVEALLEKRLPDLLTSGLGNMGERYNTIGMEGYWLTSDQKVVWAEQNHGLVASWRDAWIPEVFICISKKLHYYHPGFASALQKHYHYSGEAISCDFWRWCRGLSSLVWHGNWKFAKKKHLFTNARYRWLVNMWTAYGGRKDLAAISLQRQTMRVD